MFWEGVANGPAKITKPNGNVEELQYCNGKKVGTAAFKARCFFTHLPVQLQTGPAKLIMANGDQFELHYKDDEIEGESVYRWANGAVETSVYVKVGQR